MRVLTRAVGVLTLLGLATGPARAQTTYDACYVPTVGALYLIKQTSLPSACLSTGHVAISWSSGGLADGSVTTAKLADASVTTAKIADGAVTEAKLASQYVLADGVRSTTNGFAVTGTYGAGTIPATGGGVRVMWYPGKAAFRAGYVGGTQWDNASIGIYSTALGTSPTASGDNSMALGLNVTASGAVGTAMGSATTASGSVSTAMGSATTAAGAFSTSMGYSTTALGDYATAMGNSTTAQAYGSLVIGRYNTVTGTANSWVAAEPLFVAGNGSSPGAASNALTLLKNGDLNITGNFTSASDIRLKEDIEPIDDALNGVLGLTPIRYHFRPGTGHPSEPQIGLSAQEVQQAFPELVSQDAQGYLSVAYPNLTAVLVRALQEQQAQIAALQERIARLEAERK